MRLYSCFIFIVCFFSTSVIGADIGLIESIEASNKIDSLSPEIKTVLGLSSLSFIPLLLVALTAFTRIIIVLSMLRHALGLQQTPPNVVMIALALFLTLFTMMPVLEKVENDSLKPYLNDQIGLADAIDNAKEPFKAFMLQQTREEDYLLMVKLAKAEVPKSANQIEMLHLVPAFLISELTTAFKIAFVIFIPFLLLDLVVASVLMSLGMIMVPPISIALPLKVMLFVLIDGWSLISASLIGSFS